MNKKYKMSDMVPKPYVPRPKPKKCYRCKNELPADSVDTICIRCSELQEREDTNRRYELERQEEALQEFVTAMKPTGVTKEEAELIAGALRRYLHVME